MSLLNRRSFLKNSSTALGSMALAGLLADDGLLGTPIRPKIMADQPYASRKTHFPAKAKQVLLIYCTGAVSHIDTFDYKPLLARDHDKPLPFAKPRVQFAQTGHLMASPWSFRRHGQSGQWVSELFPHVAEMSDELCMIKSIHGSNEAHG